MADVEHRPAPVIQGSSLGNATDKIVVDTVNHTIKFYLEGVLVDSWG